MTIVVMKIMSLKVSHDVKSSMTSDMYSRFEFTSGIGFFYSSNFRPVAVYVSLWKSTAYGFIVMVNPVVYCLSPKPDSYFRAGRHRLQYKRLFRVGAYTASLVKFAESEFEQPNTIIVGCSIKCNGCEIFNYV